MVQWVFSFVFFGLRISFSVDPRSPPRKVPYKVLLSGWEVIAQDPLAQPTCDQYTHPPMAPTTAPIAMRRYFRFISSWC